MGFYYFLLVVVRVVPLSVF